MTTAVATVPGGALAGTRGLVRLALRADRWRIVIWSVAVAWLTVVSVRALDDLYASDTSRAARAELIASPAATALAGPGYGLDDYTIGAMTANELALWIMLPVGIMAVLAVTRHLRAPEEDGRLELVRSQPVGAAAPVVAGLVAAAVAVVAVGALTFVGLLTTSLDPAGSALMCAAVVVVALVLAGASAVASQLSAHARTASSLGMAAIGVAFLLRAVGDVQGPQSTSVWTWLSPFGWSQATAPYTEDRWWPLLVGLAATAVSVALAFALAGRRDLGTGLLAERPGREHGRIGGVVGLTWRRQRTAIWSWGAAIVLCGALVGVLAAQIADFVADQPALEDLFPGGVGGATAAAFALYSVFLAVLAFAYVTTAVGAARHEESAGRAETLLALPVSRGRWLGSQLALAGTAAVVMLLVAGLVMGVTAAASLDDPSQVWTLVGAAAVTIPGVLVVLGVGVVVLGFVPRAFAAVWAYVAYVGVMAMFGDLLPDGADAASPFTYLPALPAEPMTWAPVVGCTVVGVLLVLVGTEGFRRRDLQG
ncbi:ABC transporter permease [Cellulomonas sp. PhB150]|uniref:ABC transporter permease n=1 Tax=Cellulomonas sp. PhB150 TaxID=2485188 RepID=UPI000F49724C|nr:anibiotic ABC transporter [Cellulomonas sp. PhB150]ROS25966.1 ABC-2 type transport system permease protein [Cellulomonas sp. PhB150]